MARSSDTIINKDSTTDAQPMEDFHAEDFDGEKAVFIAQAGGDLHPYGSYDALAKETRNFESAIEQFRNQLRREYDTPNRPRRLRNRYRSTTRELSDQVFQLLNESKEQGETVSSGRKKKGLSLLQHIEEETEVNGPVAASQGNNNFYPDVLEFRGDNDK